MAEALSASVPLPVDEAVWGTPATGIGGIEHELARL